MNYRAYLESIQDAAIQLAVKGHKKAEGAAIVDLKLTFTSMEIDEEEGTDITMRKHFNALLIPLKDGSWRIDDTQEWEETIEQIY